MHRIVLLGEGGVGKTALAMQFCLNHFTDSYDPTIEDCFRKQIVIDQKPDLLEILDTAGQEEFVALRDQWIRDGHAFLLIYSINSKSTFEAIEKYKDHISRAKEGPVATFIVGNKSDRSHQRQVTREEGAALAKKLNVGFIETSAKLNTNVEKMFVDIVRRAREIEAESAAMYGKRNSSMKKSNQSGSSSGKKKKKQQNHCLVL